jgi:PRC-barrel domain protein
MRAHDGLATIFTAFLLFPITAGAEPLDVVAQADQPARPPAETAPAGTVILPPAIVFDPSSIQGVLGREVRSAADENMGRIADVLVDRNRQVRAAVIDFGGFLGVGSRKIAVDWQALHFTPDAPRRDRITLELTRDQVKEAPEYKEDKPIVVLSSLGALVPLRVETAEPLGEK